MARSNDGYLRAFFLPRHRLALEIVALRQRLAVFKRNQPRPRLSRLDRLFWSHSVALCQQLTVFKRKQPRPTLNHLDRFFWIALHRWYSGWSDALILVKSATVVSWHRASFRLIWRWKSGPAGRPKVSGDSLSNSAVEGGKSRLGSTTYPR